MNGPGPLTGVAPTDAAFEATQAALGLTAEEALALPNLAETLKSHVAGRKRWGSELSDGMEAPTLHGAESSVSINGGTSKIGQATVTVTDLECSDGVIHVIATVLLPPLRSTRTWLCSVTVPFAPAWWFPRQGSA